MRRVLSERQKAEELIKIINSRSKYKASIRGLMTKYLFVAGSTIKISKGFLNSIDLQLYEGRLSYYTREGLTKEEKKWLTQLEKITGRVIEIRDIREITLGGG